MKLLFGKLRMNVVLFVADALGVGIKVRESYLERHVFGMDGRKVSS